MISDVEALLASLNSYLISSRTAILDISKASIKCGLLNKLPAYMDFDRTLCPCCCQGHRIQNIRC